MSEETINIISYVQNEDVKDSEKVKLTFKLTGDKDSTLIYPQVQNQLTLLSGSLKYISDLDRIFYHLFHKNTEVFLNNYRELEDKLKLDSLNSLDSSEIKSFSLLNCSNEVKKIVSLLDSFIYQIKTESSSSGSSFDSLKSYVFRLSNYLSIDIFTEEFICYGGVQRLVDVIELTTGNVRSYTLKAFKTLVTYLNGLQYVLLFTSI